MCVAAGTARPGATIFGLNCQATDLVKGGQHVDRKGASRVSVQEGWRSVRRCEVRGGIPSRSNRPHPPHQARHLGRRPGKDGQGHVISKARLAETLGVARATIDRKALKRNVLSPDEGSRVLGMASLIGQVHTMICESGDPAGFNAAEWVARWIDRPLPALGGLRPADLMNTFEGQGLVSGMVARMQSGTY